MNLIDNAVKYGGEGPVSVRVEAKNGIVRISVADSGPGIPIAEQKRIFEKFFRGDPRCGRAQRHGARALHRPRARRADGRPSGGAVEPGAGATFVVELPRITTPARP